MGIVFTNCSEVELYLSAPVGGADGAFVTCSAGKPGALGVSLRQLSHTLITG
jgi:hypothetical protein